MSEVFNPPSAHLVGKQKSNLNSTIQHIGSTRLTFDDDKGQRSKVNIRIRTPNTMTTL